MEDDDEQQKNRQRVRNFDIIDQKQRAFGKEGTGVDQEDGVACS